ncbi:unnamed protein product [Polarella glacialis]|uniref:Uncharacterized protein n=1 Tax=Polarella glacialis TaxID=89957 RepID=A0A813GA65_POLGL|nr:unnamed protein product [Polarella glacialis]
MGCWVFAAARRRTARPGVEEERFNSSFERAVATKDRLLSYDRDAKRRTKVYDDATDWYSESANPWLNEKQRDEA